MAVLGSELSGPDAPGFWLRLLPEDALVREGAEQVGGFSSEKFLVKGAAGDHMVTGAIWMEPVSKTVVRADLRVEVPATGATSGGAITIALRIERGSPPGSRKD